MVPGQASLERHSTRYGIVTVLAGIVLLVALRVWASPIGRQISGREGITLVDFLLIPLFLVFVAIGIGLFLWEPN